MKNIHPLAPIWHAMFSRCYVKNSKDFHNYGGRGIYVDETWHNFNQFLADVGERPFPKATLDRIDNNGPYNKNNCRWATRSEQMHNSRVRKDNKTGIKGVTFVREHWSATGSIKGFRYQLYWGKNFFEACCARKSWETTLA